MKNLIKVLFIFSGFIGMAISGYGQCVADTTNCKDINEPGQICPDTLPAAVLNTLYEQVITIIPPDTFDFGTTAISIHKIIIDSVTNLPPGLSYEANASEMFPDTAYCVLISGTPTETGIFYLNIYISPYIYLINDTVKFLQTKDSTSLFIQVNSTTGLSPPIISQTKLLPVKPNPFNIRSRIGILADQFGVGELYVYYITGQLVHHEEKWIQPGKNYFDYNGEELTKGIYLYRVSFMGKSFTSRVVKM